MAYENFEDFTEIDPDSELTVDSDTVHIINQNFDADSRVYKDYGVDHFDGDITHKFELLVTDIYATTGTEGTGLWALSNTPGGEGAFANDDALFRILLWNSGTFKLQIRLHDGSKQDNSATLSKDIRYYITVTRVGSVYSAVIRTGSHEGVEIDTVSIDAGSVKSFRYLYIQYERD